MNAEDQALETDRVLGVARELYGRVVYSHKTHEKERELWTRKVRWERWLGVLLTGSTAIAAVIGAAQSNHTAFIVTSVLGGAGAAYSVYQLSFNACKTESEHRGAAKKLLELRERYLMFILRAMADAVPAATLHAELQTLQRETAIVYEYAPDTSAEAYHTAGTGLKDGEELTFSDDELDRLLPRDLRRGKPESQPDTGTT